MGEEDDKRESIIEVAESVREGGVAREERVSRMSCVATEWTYRSLMIWSSLYFGFLFSSRLFAEDHSPLPTALDSFFAKALCSRSLCRTGS